MLTDKERAISQRINKGYKVQNTTSGSNPIKRYMHKRKRKLLLPPEGATTPAPLVTYKYKKIYNNSLYIYINMK